MNLSVIEHPTDKHGIRRGGAPVDMLVLHYTGLPTLADSLEALADGPKEVSSHYLIDADGTVYRLVPEDRRSWHAGVSFWCGARDVNSRSVGIELQHPDGNAAPFPDAQIAALIPLCRDILARHPIPARNVVGHSDIAPDRKIDPGAFFPWERLAAAGVGLWPGPARAEVTGADLRMILTEIGYDPQAKSAFEAFQRRFRPARIDGTADAETLALARAYLRAVSGSA